MSNWKLGRTINSMFLNAVNLRRARGRSAPERNCKIESLETRTLFSDAATAQISLVHTATTGGATVYSYDISLKNTGTNNIGTFWFAWQPDEDFLTSVPTAISSPVGWSDSLTGSGNSSDGSAIEWTVSQLYTMTPGQTVSGFNFSSTDSPAVLAGNSPTHAGTPETTSEIYNGAPFSDAGFEFVATPPATTAASTTTLVSSAPAAAAGTPVTLTATVVSASGSGATPTGTVDFTQDGNDLGTIALQSNGTAALTTSTLPIGTDHITATYSGDSAYSGGASTALTQVISPPTNAVGTTTTLVPSVLSAAGGTSVTFTATITPATPGAVPTGTVSFTLNGTSLGSSGVQSNGTATFTTTTLPVGSDPIVAGYSGDSIYASSVSTAVTETITAPPTLVPAITKSTVPTSIVGGVASHGSVTFSITNETSALVKGKGSVAIFASTTGVIDSSSILLGQAPRQFNLKAAKALTTSLPAKILAATLPAGSYMLFAQVTDPSANIIDSVAGPAVLVAAPFISLSETVVKSTIPTSATGSSKAHAAALLQITNSGNITTPGTTTIALFATVAGVVDGTETPIATVTKPLHIHAGKSANVSIQVKEIPALAVGTYSLVVQVTDPNSQLASVALGSLTITA
jgi:hypothetical protein